MEEKQTSIDQPGVSIVVVALNEDRSISSCLESLLAQDYKGEFEILVIDNGSRDHTLQIVEDLRSKNPKIKLIHNPKRGIVFSRNIGIRESIFPFISYTDADCVAPVYWLSNLMKGYTEYKSRYPALCAVGGGNQVFLPRSYYSKALHVMLQSYLGSHGSVNGKIYTENMFVDHIPTTNVMYEKKVLLSNLFDESMVFGGSDLEISTRLEAKGYAFLYIKDTVMMHRRESTIRAWSKSMFRYGRSRLFAMSKGTSLHNIHLLLPIGVVGSFVMIFMGCIHHLFLLPFLIYVFVIVLHSLWDTLHNDIRLFPMVLGLYMTTHISYGCGEIYEGIRIIKSHLH